MATNPNRPEAPRSSSSTPIRRVRRAALPTLASLEDRKLMTGGFNMATGPMDMVNNGPAQVSQFTSSFPDSSGPRPSFKGGLAARVDSSSSSSSSTDSTAWVNAGADAQLGPYANLIFSGGDRLSGPFSDRAPTTSTSTSTTSTTTTTDDADTLKAAFDQLRNDTQTIQDASEVTPKLLAALRATRNALVTGATGTVDSDKLTTFQDDQKTIRDSGTFTADQQATLKSDYTAVLKSAGVSDDAITAYFTALDAVKTASHVTADNLTTLANDQQSIQTLLDAQKSNDGSSRDQGPPNAPDGMGQGMPGNDMAMGGFGDGLNSQQQAAPTSSQQDGGTGGTRHRAARTSQSGDGGMASRMSSMRFGGRSINFGGGHGGGRRSGN